MQVSSVWVEGQASLFVCLDKKVRVIKLDQLQIIGIHIVSKQSVYCVY